MSLVFENELYDMTETAKEVLLSDEIPWRYSGDVIFEEFPYFGYRTDLVTVRYDLWDLARRKDHLGHFEPLPDARRFRHSYNKLQDIEPVSRNYWINDDTTYSTDQTCREVWDWLAEHGYLRACDSAEVGRANVGQLTLAGDIKPVGDEISEHTPCVTVKYPMSITASAWELKPRDWKKALDQAKRADSYTDLRWVLMDAGGIEITNDVTKEFHQTGVGLATLDEDGLEIHAYPDSVHPARTGPRFMLNERALAEIPDSVRDDALEKYEELKETQG